VVVEIRRQEHDQPAVRERKGNPDHDLPGTWHRDGARPARCGLGLSGDEVVGDQVLGGGQPAEAGGPALDDLLAG
jgi:hypothetical protein